MPRITEVNLTNNKIYISKHEAFTLAFQDEDIKKKFKFEKGRLEVTDPKDIALIDAEYDRRYHLKDLNGDSVLDENGNKVYGGEMSFLPIDQYEKSRLHSPVLVKTKSGKTYRITEADLKELAERSESGNTGTSGAGMVHSVSEEDTKRVILEVLEEQGIEADPSVTDELTKRICALYGPPTAKKAKAPTAKKAKAPAPKKGK